ncbi:shikimate dehydrogenase [Luteipulveratus sp. YIM 133132]|uniref:shikimate dehydrogenase n=1 Tax=Luteipulveratus flavus TaxID=3031728 RepID=UPI0023B15DC8|nr:shikimate dehydrogenase [Luteipulveratus sp. YIM 133132]MDE9366065.1 shikimate dehydrogenase [Luteipulveratus sp. YIM 133132]
MHARAAVLGSPVSHSLSPLLHRTAYECSGLIEWTYDAYEVRRDGLADFVLGLGPQWRGLSLTMPLKEEALLVAADSTALALQVGAANTLLRRADGRWRADNTDVEGVRAALAAAGVGRVRPARRATVLGSGATARSVLAALARLQTREVTFVVRDVPRESTLAQARDHGLDVRIVVGTEAIAAWADADVVVSTTPARASDGLARAVGAAVESGAIDRDAPHGQVLLDVVYDGWPTVLAQVLTARGTVVVGGIEMLVHQAADQFTLMTGKPAPLEQMQTVGRAAVSG